MTIDFFLAQGAAVLNLSPAQFYRYRIGHFFAAIYEASRREQQNSRFIAELVRMQTTELININLPTEKKIRPAALWRFPWEEQQRTFENMTDEEIKAHNSKFLEYLDNLEI